MASSSVSPATRTAVVVAQDNPGVSYLQWSAIIAGAIGASAISFLLLTFGASIGLTLTSPWPNSGVSVWAAIIAVAWWAILVQIGSFFVGGYLAGRMRASWGGSLTPEGQFRDGAHGFMVWSVGVLLGALVVVWTGSGALKTAAQAGSTIAAGAASGNANALQTGPVDYAVDTLLRPMPRALSPAGSGGPSIVSGDTANPMTPVPQAQANPPQANNANTVALRAEVSRIYVSTVKSSEFTARDRDYLTQVVAMRTGLSQADAQQRVDQSVTELRDFEINARTAADKARRAGLIAGFLAAASLLISLGAACAAATLGGRHRDEGVAPHVFGHQIW